MRGIVHQRVALEILCKQTLAKGNTVLLAHRVEAMRLPYRLWRFDNKGRGAVVKLVGVRGKPAVFGRLKRKGKCVKGFVRAQPDKAAVAQLDIGLEGFRIAGTDAAVQSVAGNHQVGVVLRRDSLVVLHIGFKNQINAERNAALLQNVQQPLAAYAAKAVATRAHAAPFEKHLDIVPVVERIANQLGADRVSQAQIAQRLVRQHHAPAKGVKRAVALDHRHDVRGVLQLHQQGEVQTRRTTTQTKNAHDNSARMIN